MDDDLKNRFSSTKLPIFMDGSLKNKHIFFISKEIRFALNYLRDVVGALVAGAGSSKAQFSYVPFTADLTADVRVIVAEDTEVWKICHFLCEDHNPSVKNAVFEILNLAFPSL